MKNMMITIDGDMLTIKVDLSQDFGPSKSGKTTIIASSEGNKKFDKVKHDRHFIGLNVYKTI